MKVLVMGANSSGKGTLVKLLSEKTGLSVIGCSSMLKEKGLDITTGKLITDEVVNQVMKTVDVTGDFILDGYPRTMNQNKYMLENILEPDLIVVLNISEEEVLYRTVGRRICPVCGEIYNLNGFKVPKEENTCDVCKAELIQRCDDTETVARERYYEYLESTYPIVNYYKYNGGKTTVWEFDASEECEKVANEVAEYIKYMLS